MTFLLIVADHLWQYSESTRDLDARRRTGQTHQQTIRRLQRFLVELDIAAADSAARGAHEVERRQVYAGVAKCVFDFLDADRAERRPVRKPRQHHFPDA